MSDWFSTAVELQREIVRAQRAQIEAGHKMLDASSQFVSMQEAGQKAAEANMAAWKAWASMWGGGK